MTYLKGYNEPAYYLSSFNFFTWITSFNGYKIIQGKFIIIPTVQILKMRQREMLNSLPKDTQLKSNGSFQACLQTLCYSLQL